MTDIKYPFLDLEKVNAPYADELAAAAERVVRSGRYIGGDEVVAFESDLGEMLKAPYIIGVSNGLDALRLTLRGWIATGRLSEGDEVIVPANTYIASVLAVSDARLRPILVDPVPGTMNIDATSIEKALTPATRAVMPVHLYGRVAWDDDMRRVIEENNLLVIEDCAQAIGARATTNGLYDSRMAGALGHAGCLSFYPTKNTGALGDAGAIVTHDKTLADTARALANYGADRRYHNIYRGYNCRLDPIQAAMLRVKLPYTNSENADRFARALAYSREISRQDIITPEVSDHCIDNVWHQYVIRFTGGNRDLFRERLLEAGVATDIHYAVPPHLQPCYSGLRHSPLPVTELLASQIISLPIARGTSIADAAEIANIINNLQL